MTDKLLKEISRKLNVLISMSLGRINDDRQFENSGERIQGVGAMTRYLSDMGIEPEDISEILGAPLQSVRTLLTPKRRK
jgi:hypothetical protein